MADSYDWQMARRAARLAAHSPARGVRRDELARAMDVTVTELGSWVRLAYARGWADCIGQYVVAPAVAAKTVPARPVSPPALPAQLPLS